MVRIELSNKGNLRTLRLRGHADTPPSGDASIICAACSMLTYTLAQCVTDMAAAGLVEVDKMRLEPGDADVIYTIRAGHEAAADTSASAILRGYELLAAQYPKIFRIMHADTPEGGEKSRN